jgi:predicted regulator of Ras-like GTPase activity (Roadblock/LC7/MglB family)
MSRLGHVSRDVLNRLLGTLGEVAGLKSAVLFSPDGFEIASYGADAAMSARLAAIGSSLAALGTAISSEASLGAFGRTTIESSEGTVVIMRVDGADAASLAVVAAKGAVLGQLLWATHQCCTSLARAMEK